MAVPKRVATEPRVTTSTRTPAKPRKSTVSKPQPMAANNRFAPGLVGARLRERRLERGITLRQFARDIDVSASFISQLETGKAQPSVATFYSICAALDISIDELFNYDEPAGPTPTSDPTVAPTPPTTRRPASSERYRPNRKERVRRDGASSPVVRPNERKVLVLDSGVTWESLISSHREKTDFMFVRYEVGGSSTLEDRLIRHVGTEYGFILKGTLQIALGFDTYVPTLATLSALTRVGPTVRQRRRHRRRGDLGEPRVPRELNSPSRRWTMLLHVREGTLNGEHSGTTTRRGAGHGQDGPGARGTIARPGLVDSDVEPLREGPFRIRIDGCACTCTHWTIYGTTPEWSSHSSPTTRRSLTSRSTTAASCTWARVTAS